MSRWKILNGYPEEHYRSLLSDWESKGEVRTILPEERNLFPELIQDCDIYLAAMGIPFSEELVEHAPRLKLVATPTTGTDHLPITALERQKIAWYCLRQSPEFLRGITSTAEHCWGLLLASIRHIVPAFRDVCAGGWHRERFTGNQMKGRTLGVVGYGRLGQMVAHYGLAFGMRVLATDVRAGIKFEAGVESCTLEELLSQADVVSVHIHLDEANRHFFDEARFRQMKKGAVFLNTSRGGIVREDALLDALESGRLSAAALDVLENEWGDLQANPLIRYARSHDNLLITPHCGGASVDAQQLTFQEMLRNVEAFMQRANQKETKRPC